MILVMLNLLVKMGELVLPVMELEELPSVRYDLVAPFLIKCKIFSLPKADRFHAFFFSKKNVALPEMLHFYTFWLSKNCLFIFKSTVTVKQSKFFP